MFSLYFTSPLRQTFRQTIKEVSVQILVDNVILYTCFWAKIMLAVVFL